MPTENDAPRKQALALIAAQYTLLNRESVWTASTRQLFILALMKIPAEYALEVATELLLHPPTAANGYSNYQPLPADLIKVYTRMTAPEPVTPSDIVSEIRAAISEHGTHGKRVPGTNRYQEGMPELSPIARQVVRSMGGWGNLCTMDAPDGVWQGQLNLHAKNALLSGVGGDSSPLETKRELIRSDDANDRLKSLVETTGNRLQLTGTRGAK